MKDTFGEEVIPSMVIKTPNSALNSTLQRLQEMTEKYTSTAAKSKTTSPIQIWQLQVILSRILVTTAIYITSGNNAKTYR